MWVIYVFIFSAGVINTAMAGCNATLAKHLKQPFAAAVIVFAVGLIAALSAAFISSLSTPSQVPFTLALKSAPWWAWVGGAMGAFYIIAGITVAEKAGAAVFIALSVTAAVCTSLTLDHFALLGFKQHPAGIGRMAGAALIVGGLILISKF